MEAVLMRNILDVKTSEIFGMFFQGELTEIKLQIAWDIYLFSYIRKFLLTKFPETNANKNQKTKVLCIHFPMWHYGDDIFLCYYSA